MFPILCNFYEVVTSEALAANGTTVQVDSVSGLPGIARNADYIPAVLRSQNAREVVYITKVNTTTNTLTLLRGRELTSAIAWPAGTYCYVTATAGAIQDIFAEAWRPVVNNNGSRPTITRSSDTAFTISGDYTGSIQAGQAIRVFDGTNYVSPTDVSAGAAHVVASVYASSVTTVTVNNITLPSTIKAVDVGPLPGLLPLASFDAEDIAVNTDTLVKDGGVIGLKQIRTGTSAYGETAAKALSFGGTFKVPKVAFDAYGRVSTVNHYTMTMPSLPDGTTSAKGIVKLSSAVDSTSAALAATPAAVKQAYDIADAALPKSGGTMTGNITLGAHSIMGSLTTGRVGVFAGASSADGAGLQLFGRADSTYAGRFYLRASTKSSSSSSGNECTLVGNPNGTLTWGGDNVVTAPVLATYADLSADNTVTTGNFLHRNNKTSYLRVSGGSAANEGANLILYGESNTAAPGRVYIQAKDASQNRVLTMDPDGVMTWTGASIRMTGNQSTLSTGLLISGTGSYPMHFQHTGLTKGSTPSATQYKAIDFYGSVMGSYTNRYAVLQHSVTNANLNSLEMSVYDPRSATGGKSATIGVYADASGNGYTSAPTPATGDASTKIATTKFVDDTVKALAATGTKAQKGYVKLSNGLIIQWGLESRNGSSKSVEFRTQFPTACYMVNISDYNSTGANSEYACSLKSYSKTGFEAATPSSITGFTWIAIGA